MTAEMAGKAAVEGVTATLRRAREQWLLLAFFAGALLWLRDTYDEFANLPALMRQQMSGLAAVEATVARLEAEVTRRLEGDRSPILGFPGTRHGIDDGAPGNWTVIRWMPVRRLRDDCTPLEIDVWMVDRAGRWFSVETSVAPVPSLQGDTDIAFGARVDPRMEPGRAAALAQIAFDCGTHRQVETAPRLQFQVLKN